MLWMAAESCGGVALTNAEGLPAVSLAKQLRLLESQLDEYRRQTYQHW